MTKIVSNDSVSVEDVRSETTAVSVPSGPTWGEVGAYAKAVLLHPGFVYHNAAKGRAGLRKWDITRDELYETDEDADFAFRLIGAVVVPVAAIIIAPNSFAPVWPLILIGGIATGFVASPALVNNTGHFIAAALLDVGTLFRKAKGTTLISGAGRRYENFKRTPVHETLRLRK